MFAVPNDRRWVCRLGAMAVVAVLATAAILSTIAVSGQAPHVVVAVCFLVAPPMFIVGIVLSGRLMLDFGLSEKSKGELERLLATKRETDLRLDARCFWHRASQHIQVKMPDKTPVPDELAHHVQPEIKKVPLPFLEVVEVLDHLVDWKRHHQSDAERTV